METKEEARIVFICLNWYNINAPKRDTLNIPVKSHNPNIRPEYQEKLNERELWHKLVVKVINWKDAESLMDKITIKEWSTYCEKMIIINVTKGKQFALDSLEETRKTIMSHGGFK